MAPSAADLLCHRDQAQLIVIDIQAKLGSVMPAKVVNRVVQNTGLLLKAAGLLGVPCVATTQYSQGLGPLEPAINEQLPASTARIDKTCFSCTGADGFLDAVRNNGRRQIVLTGMEAHVCVLQSALNLVAAGYRVFVVEDAICSRKLENYQNALVRLQQSGIIVVSAESVTFEWLKDSRDQHFKALSALIR